MTVFVMDKNCKYYSEKFINIHYEQSIMFLKELFTEI